MDLLNNLSSKRLSNFPEFFLSMLKRKWALCIITFTFFYPVYSQQYNRISERTKKVIDSTYNTLIEKYKVIGLSLAIVDNGEIVYSAGYGFADRENRIPATDKTIYRIGSCTKSFTSLSILQLQERGKLKINNSVKDYLPELNIESRFGDNNPIRLNDMMCHVSGLPCDIYNGAFSDSPPDMKWLIGELNKHTTIAPQRYMHSYSNVAYGLLGEVVARAGKTSYSNYLKDNIFTPLEMHSSFVEPDANLVKDFSKGYFMNKELNEPLIRDAGAGMVHSSSIDMAHYLLMYLNHGSYKGKQIVSAASVNDMQEDHTRDILLSSTENYGYGLCNKKFWIKAGKDSGIISTVGHSGGSIVFMSDFQFIPELNIGTVILTNTDNGGNLLFGNNKYQLLSIYLKEAKVQRLGSKYKEKVNNTNMESIPQADEIKGQYNLGEVLVNVKNEKKINTRYGMAKFVLKQKKSEPGHYTGKIFLFGFIPIRKLNEEYTFVKVNNEVYIKSINKRLDIEKYLSKRTKPADLPANWRKKIGSYVITGISYNRKTLPVLVSEGMQLKLYLDKGFIAMKIKGKTEDMNERYYLDVLSDKVAVIGGIGEESGSTVRILDNGNMYYSGFEFSKK